MFSSKISFNPASPRLQKAIKTQILHAGKQLFWYLVLQCILLLFAAAAKETEDVVIPVLEVQKDHLGTETN